MVTNYGNDFEHLYGDLANSKSIVIDNKKYKELINISYELTFSTDFIFERIPPHQPDDLNERQYLIRRLFDCISILENDKHSRRAAYANVYTNKMCKCISMVQVFIRDGNININEFYRSQHAIRNFDFDVQTASILMDMLTHELNVQPGKITVFVTSFHKDC